MPADMCIIILSWLSWEGTKCRINVINTALCAIEVKKVEQIYSDLDNHWCLAFFLLITSSKDPWVGPKNVSGTTRPLSAILCASPRQPSSSGLTFLFSWIQLGPQTIRLPSLGGFSMTTQPISLFVGLVRAPTCAHFRWGQHEGACNHGCRALQSCLVGLFIPCLHLCFISSGPFCPKYSGHRVTWLPSWCIMDTMNFLSGFPWSSPCRRPAASQGSSTSHTKGAGGADPRPRGYSTLLIACLPETGLVTPRHSTNTDLPQFSSTSLSGEPTLCLSL